MSLPEITHRFPRCPLYLRYAGRVMLSMFGWEIDGQAPDLAKAVVIAAPHTSNWDFWFGIAASWVYGIRCSWLGKDSLFRWPWGAFMRWTGGISVDRSHKNGLVGQAISSFQSSEALMLMVPAEGTRGWSPYWRSGFYWMAVEANVPIVCGFVDFGRKRAGFGYAVMPTGDVLADMAKIRAFYAEKTAAYPECAGPVRLKAEDEALAAQAPE